MFCPYCGKKIAKTSTYCRICGKKVIDTTKTQLTKKQKSNEGKIIYGGFWIRCLAYIIDSIIIYLIATGIYALITIVISGDPLMADEDYQQLFQGIFIIIFYLYYWVLTAIIQTSIGKRLLNMKIVSKKGNEISWGQAFMREVVGKFISSIILNIGFFMIGFTDKKQGLHDNISDTYVIIEK